MSNEHTAVAKTKKRLKHGECMVAIICPSEVEMNGVRYLLEEEHAKLPRQAGDAHRYIFGERSRHHVAAPCFSNRNLLPNYSC